ncbi:MAG: dihydropyrimidinase [Caldilineaceae bacterium]|nr:dihydropyrimidinase [Caldilineaceae bacterium]
MYDLAITNGQLITPAGPNFADLAVNQQSIAAIGAHLNADRTIDAAGCYVIPGGVDCHVHLQLQLGGLTSTDSFETGTVAAACGGTTTVIDFTDPQPHQPLMEALRKRKSAAGGRVAVDYGLHMTIPTWHASAEDRLHDLPDAVTAGCATFKLYQAYDRMQLDDVALLRAMRAVAAAGGGVVLHSETGPLLDQLRADAVAAGHSQPIWHERTRPANLEASAVQRAAEIAALAGCPLHIFHVGAADSLAQVKVARDRGLDITAETCPHYLLLTAADHLAASDGHLFICAPPLRTTADQDAMWQALLNGSLDIVSTDHCPWTRNEKQRPSFADVPGGLPGIEARLSLVHNFGVNDRELPLSSWVSACCTAPARRMGLPRKGALLPGYDADVVIFDPTREKTIRADDLKETAGWTPYQGLNVVGWPRTVLLRGAEIVLDEQFVGLPGHGRYLHRKLDS